MRRFCIVTYTLTWQCLSETTLSSPVVGIRRFRSVLGKVLENLENLEERIAVLMKILRRGFPRWWNWNPQEILDITKSWHDQPVPSIHMNTGEYYWGSSVRVIWNWRRNPQHENPKSPPPPRVECLNLTFILKNPPPHHPHPQNGIRHKVSEFFRSHGLLDWSTLILSGNKTNKQ